MGKKKRDRIFSVANRSSCLSKPMAVPFEYILNGDENTLVFENLNPNTPYEVSITAIYPDESESEDLSGTERTRRCLTFK